jgi:acyl carrier protein
LTREAVLEVLREAVAAFNAIHGEKQLTFALETPLFGSAAHLDSLDLVLFLVEVEARLAERFGLERPLSDDRAMSQQRSPFRTIATLADYVLSLGTEAND